MEDFKDDLQIQTYTVFVHQETSETIVIDLLEDTSFCLFSINNMGF